MVAETYAYAAKSCSRSALAAILAMAGESQFTNPMRGGNGMRLRESLDGSRSMQMNGIVRSCVGKGMFLSWP